MFNLNKEYNTSYQKKKRNIITPLLLRKVAWLKLHKNLSIAKSDRQSFQSPLWEFWKFRNGFEISTLLLSLTLHLKLETTTESECIPCNWSLIWLNPTLFTESCQSHPAPLPLNSLTPTPQPPPTPPPPPTFQLPFTYSTPPPPP